MTDYLDDGFSVLLSVYIRELPDNLSQALDSIWYQQSLKPNQIVLVTDGPLTAELESVIHCWSKKLGEVFTIVNLSINLGLGSALNQGLQFCKYDLVARMDTDDISQPDRFKKQVDFMRNNPDIVVSSGFIEEWDSDFTRKISSRSLPLNHEDIIRFAKMRSPISHAACIFRKAAIIDVGGYPEIYPEDYLLWIKLIQRGGRLSNIPCILLRVRAGDDFIARRGYTFLKGELTTYQHMYEMNFITTGEYIKASFIRACVRLSPKFIKVFLYKTLR